MLPLRGATSLVPFMYQLATSPLKATDADFDTYTLGIPNEEVREGLYQALLPAYAPAPDLERDAFAVGFARAVRSDDIDAALRRLRSFLRAIPYDMAPKCEKDFQTVLFLAFKVAGIRVSSEVRTSVGRVDLVAESASAVYVDGAQIRRHGRGGARPDRLQGLLRALGGGTAGAW